MQKQDVGQGKAAGAGLGHYCETSSETTDEVTTLLEQVVVVCLSLS